MKDQEFDIVVAGCGVAGLWATVAAAQAKARVALLERANSARGLNGDGEPTPGCFARGFQGLSEHP